MLFATLFPFCLHIPSVKICYTGKVNQVLKYLNNLIFHCDIFLIPYHCMYSKYQQSFVLFISNFELEINAFWPKIPYYTNVLIRSEQRNSQSNRHVVDSEQDENMTITKPDKGTDTAHVANWTVCVNVTASLGWNYDYYSNVCCYSRYT